MIEHNVSPQKRTSIEDRIVLISLTNHKFYRLSYQKYNAFSELSHSDLSPFSSVMNIGYIEDFRKKTILISHEDLILHKIILYWILNLSFSVDILSKEPRPE